MKKRIAVLGATGSIGKSALDVIRRLRNEAEPVLFSAHTDGVSLLALGREFPGAKLVLSGLSDSDTSSLPGASYGRAALLRLIAESGADIVLNGISGAAGLEPSLAALDAGADLALANKETMVMAGPLVLDRAARKGVKVLPVDSEHSAIFHLLEAHGRENLDEILLTASGGPFRNYSAEQLSRVTPEEALAHPTWNMGPKITIDSATLANKGLEVIEAVRLFGAAAEQVRVTVHPQSIVHSMIRLKDGQVYAQMALPDMRLPITAALCWPRILPSPLEKLDFSNLTLEFAEPDTKRFPMLSLAYAAARAGGLYPAAYNGANEIAAAAFLSGSQTFLDIPGITGYVLERDWKGKGDDLESILEADRKARELAAAYIAEKKA